MSKMRREKIPFEVLMEDFFSTDLETRMRAASRLCRDYRDRPEPIPPMISILEDENEPMHVRRMLALSVEQYDDIGIFVGIMKVYRDMLREKGAALADSENFFVSPDELHSKLRTAVQRFQPKLAAYLISKGAKVDAENELSSPLFIAASSGQVELTKLLLQHGARVNFTSRFGYTPLHLAAATGKEELIRLLLDAGANPDAICRDGRPFEIAAKKGNQSIAKILKDAIEKNGGSV